MEPSPPIGPGGSSSRTSDRLCKSAPAPIWTRRNEIWWRRRTWRTEDRESALVVFVRGGNSERQEPWMSLRWAAYCFSVPGRTDGARRKLFFFFSSPLHSRFERLAAEARCNAAVRSHFAFFSLWSGGIRGRAERAPARSPSPTRCRGSAAGSGARARSCRCPRAGRKPGTTTAECSSSTTTPGKLHGLTPEIGNGNRPCWSGSSGITRFNTHTLT